MMKKSAAITGAFLTLVIPYMIMITNPHVEASQSLCPFKMLTGLPCPGCGVTKSMICFYEGDFLKSLHYHLFGPLVIFFCVAVIIILIVEIFTGQRYFRKIFYSQKIAYAAAIFLAAYHLTRLIWFIHTHNFSQILAESIWR
ncbi:MAG TPA: DUF2752 domain-containing protein [Draconibacterium sp.]|nr:DUF2752 domain-containing protein [Draconibacterium sp.]